jgi:RNA-directed DNA polymerase
MKRVLSRQLNFVFAESPGKPGDGLTPASGAPDAKAWLARIAKGKGSNERTTEAADASRLLEQVASWSNLAKALQQVVRNRGAAGVDGQSVSAVVREARTLLPKLSRSLLDGTYSPGDIRRVWIPKTDGGQRGLGIPNVIDRWVQQAAHQVLEPIFEPLFHSSSHGFRPHRGAPTAIAEAKRHVEAGGVVVVDLDLSKFFDRVNHQRLLGRMSQRVKDRRLLQLIHRMLKAKVVLPDGAKADVEEGTPQGGPLSPLLSNIVLDELDWELERRGLKFVRYADDANIYVRSERAGHRVMDSIRRFIEKRLRLKVNEEKSSVTRPHKSHFLGFRLNRRPEGGVHVQLSRRSVDRMYAKLRELTPRNWGQSLSACIRQLNRYLQGWGAYFRLCSRADWEYFRDFDAHIRRRLRVIIIQQKKRARHLYRHLVKRGVPRSTAARTAWSRRGVWYQSRMKGMHRGYPNEWFEKQLVNLEAMLRPPPVSVSSSGQQLNLFAL